MINVKWWLKWVVIHSGGVQKWDVVVMVGEKYKVAVKVGVESEGAIQGQTLIMQK